MLLIFDITRFSHSVNYETDIEAAILPTHPIPRPTPKLMSSASPLYLTRGIREAEVLDCLCVRQQFHLGLHDLVLVEKLLNLGFQFCNLCHCFFVSCD